MTPLLSVTDLQIKGLSCTNYSVTHFLTKIVPALVNTYTRVSIQTTVTILMSVSIQPMIAIVTIA